MTRWRAEVPWPHVPFHLHSALLQSRAQGILPLWCDFAPIANLACFWPSRLLHLRWLDGLTMAGQPIRRPRMLRSLLCWGSRPSLTIGSWMSRSATSAMQCGRPQQQPAVWPSCGLSARQPTHLREELLEADKCIGLSPSLA
jgi:hypothetical protein